METMQCATATTTGIGSLLLRGAAKGRSSRSRGNHMRVVMRSGTTANSNRLSLLQALSQTAAVQSQRCKLFSSVTFYISCEHTLPRTGGVGIAICRGDLPKFAASLLLNLILLWFSNSSTEPDFGYY